ncbi:MAG: RNA polymerase sigma factor [Vicinamibacterales bacterium]
MPEFKADSSVDLLLKAQSGDDDALNQLLTRYLPRLQRWASGRLPWGLRTMLDTGDLVQDAIMNALPNLKKFEIRSDRALQFYLQRAIRHRIIDLYKRGRRRPAREEIAEDTPAAGVSPQEAAIGAEAFDRYERALMSLKAEERQAIVLRFELGLEYGEIATQLGKPSSDAARMAVTRAVVRLADKMGHRPHTAGNGI